VSFLKFIFLKFIFVYQKIFTLLDFGSCRFYPCCSQYAKITIKYNNLLKALFYSTKRILKCNQYFIGGIDYPIVNASFFNKNNFASVQKCFNINNVKVWLVSTNKNKQELYWISNFSKKS